MPNTPPDPMPPNNTPPFEDPNIAGPQPQNRPAVGTPAQAGQAARPDHTAPVYVYDPETGQVVDRDGYRYGLGEWERRLETDLATVGIHQGEEFNAQRFQVVGDRFRDWTPAEQAARRRLDSAVHAHLDQVWHPDVLAAAAAFSSAVEAANNEWQWHQDELEEYIAEVNAAEAAELRRFDSAAAALYRSLTAAIPAGTDNAEERRDGWRQGVKHVSELLRTRTTTAREFLAAVDVGAPRPIDHAAATMVRWLTTRAADDAPRLGFTSDWLAGYRDGAAATLTALRTPTPEAADVLAALGQTPPEGNDHDWRHDQPVLQALAAEFALADGMLDDDIIDIVHDAAVRDYYGPTYPEVDPEAMDILIHDPADERAETINGAGVLAQLTFLAAACADLPELRDLLTEITTRRSAHQAQASDAARRAAGPLRAPAERNSGPHGDRPAPTAPPHNDPTPTRTPTNPQH